MAYAISNSIKPNFWPKSTFAIDVVLMLGLGALAYLAHNNALKYAAAAGAGVILIADGLRATFPKTEKSSHAKALSSTSRIVLVTHIKPGSDAQQIQKQLILMGMAQKHFFRTYRTNTISLYVSGSSQQRAEIQEQIRSSIDASGVLGGLDVQYLDDHSKGPAKTYDAVDKHDLDSTVVFVCDSDTYSQDQEIQRLKHVAVSPSPGTSPNRSEQGYNILVKDNDTRTPIVTAAQHPHGEYSRTLIGT